MPYATLTELPQGVRNSLPKHAQEIYRSAFNNAFDTYKSKEDRYDPEDSREEVAHRVAWSAVKEKYQRTDTGWQRREET